MRAQVYCAYTGVLQITVATPRSDQTASTRFAASKAYEDYCARARALLKEHRHIGTTSLEYPAANRLQTYFPSLDSDGVRFLYALRELKPAGTQRDFNLEFMMDVMRVRYSFTINLLPAAFQADEVVSEAIERHMEYAVDRLFEANGLTAFTASDDEMKAGDRTEIDILCELGPATERIGIELPAPSQS